MNIQIFGKNKCFDTKKAQRYFKERNVKFQAIDLLKYGISRGELTTVKNAVGLEALLDPKAADAALVTYRPTMRTSWKSCWRTPGSSAPPSSAMGSRPPWATAPRCGRPGPEGMFGLTSLPAFIPHPPRLVILSRRRSIRTPVS